MTPPVDVTSRDETRLHLLEIVDAIEAGDYAAADTKTAALLSSIRRAHAHEKRSSGEEERVTA